MDIYCKDGFLYAIDPDTKAVYRLWVVANGKLSDKYVAEDFKPSERVFSNHIDEVRV